MNKGAAPPLVVKPVGAKYEWEEASIDELNWGDDGLRLVVAQWMRACPNERRHIEYFWRGMVRHRILEEVDLARYWTPGSYQPGYLLFEVLSGGWLAHGAASERIEFLSTIEREWFLFTNNWSATVISAAGPRIIELT